jgi:hypothetical protein
MSQKKTKVKLNGLRLSILGDVTIRPPTHIGGGQQY